SGSRISSRSNPPLAKLFPNIRHINRAGRGKGNMKANPLATLVMVASLTILTSGGVGLAQQDATRAEAGTTLITLGTAGGPMPRADRAQSSNLLVVNGTLYLIDAGDGVTRRIVQAGYDFRKVGKIFITHAHSDHDNGLATLLNSEWEYQRATPIDIYGGGLEPLVKGAIAYLQPNADNRWSEGKKRSMADTFQAHDIAPGVIYQDANVKVSAVENTHFHFQQGDPAFGKYRAYSFRFETPDKVVF